MTQDFDSQEFEFDKIEPIQFDDFERGLNEEIVDKEVLWKVYFYIDVCHSGSAVEQTKKWINEEGGEVKDAQGRQYGELPFFE